MKIATWNVNSLRVRLPQVLDWLKQHEPDLLAIQETKVPDDEFPLAEIQAAGYECVYSGQRTYNGVTVLYRGKAESIVKDIPLLDDHQRRVLAMTWRGIRVINLYVPNGESVHSDKYQYKLKWLKHLSEWLAIELKSHPNLVVLGDFNIAPENQDIYDPHLEGQILCSEPERQAFQALLKLGLKDSFRLFPQPNASFTWWDYRMNAFKRNRGLRIDHILISEPLTAVCQKVLIDQVPRANERPSDHAILMAEFAT